MHVRATVLVSAILAANVLARVTHDPILRTITNVGIYGTTHVVVRYKAWWAENQQLPIDKANELKIGSFGNNGYIRATCYRKGGFLQMFLGAYCNCPSGSSSAELAIHTSRSSFNS